MNIGACAWGFDDWRGVFYPEQLPPGERLAFYARHFPAVEVDSTFYAAPSLKVAAHWREITPPHFLFACKAPREITHDRRLRDCQAPLAAFLESLRPLGEKLACVLLQLPPSFRPRSDETALRKFLRMLPADVRFALEFRQHEWHLPRIVHLLQEHRVCWVWTDVTPLDHQREGAFEFVPETADFTYLRLLGDLKVKYGPEGEASETYDRLRWPRDLSLESWAVRLRQLAPAQRQMLVFINNHFEGFAPATGQRLAALLGLPVPSLPAAAPEAGQLELL